MLSTLAEVFGYAELRPGQDEAIAAVLGGRNVFAVMPTGAGKSLCYQLPALILGGLTLVVSPLLALMRDQVAALTLDGIAAATINSDADRAENVAVWRRVQAGQVRVLYMSPERLMTPAMLRALARLDLKLIAIDEAHCISQWGPAFRPEYEALGTLRGHFPGVPIIGLTATADPATRADIEAKIFGGDAVTVVTGFDRPNLSLGVMLKSNWKKQVADFVTARPGASGIVYCLSRRKTEEVAALLCEKGATAIAFHAGMDSAVKEQAQNRFMTEPGVVMVATVAFGMGIDKPDIRYVLHTDLPGSPEAYYQEIGRAGRDGLPAETLLLYGLDDIRMRRVFIEQEESAPERKRREHKRLDSLIAYCEAAECRRRMLLRYFGDAIAPCGNCDVCLDPVETRDGAAEARWVLEAVHATGQKFGAAHIVDVLRGAKNDKTARFGHESLPVFGAGAERSQRRMAGHHPPDGRGRSARHRHRRLWRPAHDRGGRRGRARRGPVPLPPRPPAPAGKGQARLYRHRRGRQPDRRQRSRDPRPRRRGPAAAPQGPPPRPRPRARRPRLCHLLRPHLDRHGRAPAQDARRLRRGVRGGRGEAQGFRGGVPA